MSAAAAVASRQFRPLPAAPARVPHSKTTIAVLIVVGALVVGVAAFAATKIFGGGGGNEPARVTNNKVTPVTGAGTSAPRRRAAATPETTTVAVLNGTPIPGLAASTADQLVGDGYKKDNIATGNNTDQQRQQSLVLYRRGARRQAANVAKILDIRTLQPVDAETQALANNAGKGKTADVIVIVGGDKSR
jgi:hypothetical protein